MNNILLVHNNVEAYNVLKKLCSDGYRQDIERGSFERTETYRLQAFPVMIQIAEPTNFLYLPKEVTVGMIEKYYNEYLISSDIAEHETYTYGSRIAQQLYYVMNMLKRTPMTNQASISISEPTDIVMDDPPCLREITFSVFPGEKKILNVTTFWRSNDIGEAFLLNQGGIALLLRDIAEYAGLDVGSHYYVSPGAHIYHYGGSQ